jgi:hypothetical protein
VTTPLTVVPIGRPNLADIAAMLEHTAARIRSGDIDPTTRAVLVLLVGEPGHRQIEVFDFGADDDGMPGILGSIGMLTVAQHRVMAKAQS